MGGKRGMIPSSPIRHQLVLRVIPLSRACVFRRKYNKTPGAAMRHQNGRFWLQRVFRCLTSWENRRYHQAVNNRYGNNGRESVSSQNANRHQISKGLHHTVIPHQSTFISWKSNDLKVYLLLYVCYLLCHWDNTLKIKNPQVCAIKAQRLFLGDWGLQQVPWKQELYVVCLTERFSSANQRLVSFFGDLSCVVTRREGRPHFLRCCSRSFLEH